MDRVTQRLWRGVEGPRRCFLVYAAISFSTTQARSWRTRHGLSLDRERVRTAGRIPVFSFSGLVVEKLRAA